ncbi:MAG: calcium-binding protein [Actinomycetes bacterium]
MSGFTPDTAGLRSGNAASSAAVQRVLAGAALTASVLGLALTAAPQATAASEPCTITGNSNSNVLRGTPGNDVICGLGGNDVIYGGGGNDVIKGGTGNDRISGDGGNDVISGEAGNDSVNGGVGNDTVDGGTGNDSIGGVTGNDVLDGDTGRDQLSGGSGDDALQGGTGIDQISPGTGANTCAADSTDRVAGSCTIDRTGPTAAWVDVPSTVTAGETFTATFSLKDPSSIDPNSPNVKIGGAPGWITTWCGDAGSFPLMASLASGSIADGVWSVTCTVPAKAVNDTYSFFLSAQDSFANSADGPSADFTVVGGSADNGAPLISDVVIPTSAEPGETITLTWRAADPSGVKDTPYPWVYRPAPQFGVIYGEGVSSPVLTSGTALDGTWSQTITLPANSVSGTYYVYISVRDELGNKTYERYGSFQVG